MWKGTGLRIRIYALLAALVLISLLGGMIMVWYTYRMEGLLTEIIDENVAAFQAAEALEIALVNQKGRSETPFKEKRRRLLKRDVKASSLPFLYNL